MTKRFLTAVVALVLVALVPTVAFASSFSAGTWEELRNAFADEDDEITITLTGDITLVEELEAKEGRTYIINGKEYVLSDVRLTGKGTVKADVKQIDDRLAVRGKVNAEINTNKDENGEGGSVTNIDTHDDSKLTINGDVNGDDAAAVYANGDSEITINGDVNGSDATDDKDNDRGVVAWGNSKVTVNGDVNGGDGNSEKLNEQDPKAFSDGDEAVRAGDNAQVTVNGNVKGGDGYGSYAYGGDGVSASEKAQVTVNGDVEGGSQISNSDVYEDNYEGVGGSGISAEDSAQVEVNGNVKGGDANGVNSIGGTGIDMKSTTNIKVDGDVEGGVSSGEQGTDGAGIEITLVSKEREGKEAGSVYVSGCVKSNASAMEYSMYVNGELLPVLNDKLKETFSEEAPMVLMYMTMVADAVSDNTESYLEACDTLIGMVCYKAGISEKDTETMTAEELIEVIGNMTKAQRIELLDEFSEYYGEMLRSGYYMPDVTVWGFDSGKDHKNVEITVTGRPGALSNEDSQNSEIEGVLSDLIGGEVNYIIKVEQPANGSVSVDKETAVIGETVTITASPAEGYLIDKVYVNGEEIAAADGKYSFVVEEGGHYVVSASFAKSPSDKPSDDKKADEGKKKTDVIKTGYESNMVIMSVVIAACVMGIAFVAVKRKREK